MTLYEALHFIILSEFFLYYSTWMNISAEQEWMSDSLSKGFYNGKPNPFEVRTAVPYVHFPFFFFFFTVFNYFLSVCFSESSSLYLCT